MDFISTVDREFSMFIFFFDSHSNINVLYTIVYAWDILYRRKYFSPKIVTMKTSQSTV